MNRKLGKPLKTRASGTFDVYGSPCGFSGLLLVVLETGDGKEQGVHFCTLPNEHLDTVFRKSEPPCSFRGLL
jgi:hypothetical protein